DWICPKQCHKIAEILDLCRDVSAKAGTQPIGRFFRQCSLTVQRKLIFTLLHINLLDVDVAIIKGRAQHDELRCTISPTQLSQLSPKGSGCMRWVARVAPKNKFGRVQRTVDMVGEAERFRRLGKRNVRSRARDVPCRSSPSPVVRDFRPDFSTEGVEIEIKINCLLSELG